ncbi:MAG: PepSY-associated TM helix domain-containing protein [bacterium]|nr:PepSY-associated TM helix domain-containing protein [bacterium]
MKFQTPYAWMRDLHLYLGLFVSPFVLLFAVSTLFLNHATIPAGSVGEKRTVPVEIPEGLEKLEEAQAIQRQVGVPGEINYISRRKGFLVIPVMQPGRSTTIRVDLEKKIAEVEEEDRGILGALLYLHKSPGPHNVDIRGNWVFTHAWRWLVDVTVCMVIFLSISGIYLWAVLRRERTIGLVLMGAGCISFFALVAVVVL